MATSFLPDQADAPQAPRAAENTTQSENFEPTSQSNLESIPETPMPVEAMEGHPAENEHFLEDERPQEPIARSYVPHASAPIRPIPQVRDELAVQIEKIMEENLGDVYSALTPVQKEKFKIKGEETANKIRHIIQTTRVKLGRIVKLIFEWLQLLPGINHFFLEQEAKIKAEKIIALGEHKKHLQ